MFEPHHTFKDKAEIVCTAFFGFICFISVGNVVSICGLAYAYVDYQDDECPTSNDICSPTCNPDVYMDPSVYLKIGGWGMIGLSLMSLFFSFYVIGKKFFKSKFDNSYDYNPLVPEYSQLCLTTIIALFEVAFSVFGLLIESQLNAACKSTPKGKMLLAWTIIYLIFGICQCCGVCNTKRVLHLQRKRKKTTS